MDDGAKPRVDMMLVWLLVFQHIEEGSLEIGREGGNWDVGSRDRKGRRHLARDRSCLTHTLGPVQAGDKHIWHDSVKIPDPIVMAPSARTGFQASTARLSWLRSVEG